MAKINARTIMKMMGKAGITSKATQEPPVIKKEKVKKTLAVSVETQEHVIKRTAQGASIATIANEVSIPCGGISAIRARKFIGNKEGKDLLKSQLTELALEASEVARTKIEDCSARDAAVVMGIATSNLLAVEAKSSAQETQVTPRELRDIAARMSKLRPAKVEEVIIPVQST